MLSLDSRLHEVTNIQCQAARAPERHSGESQEDTAQR